LIKWTKGFTAKGVEGQDVVDLLNVALDRKSCHAQVNALCNDTVGTLLAGCYQEVRTDCCIGLILGTGFNACYVEKMSNIRKLNCTDPSIKHMIINMESGNFGSRTEYIGIHLPLTRWDVILNEKSWNKNYQLLEKQISGMYLGEIVRIILVDFVDQGLIFSGQKIDPRFRDSNEFRTADMSDIEIDHYPFYITKEKLAVFGIQSSVSERKFVQEIVRCVATRAAILSAIQTAACIRQLNKENSDVVVAVDGSVFEKYPGFKANMDKALLRLGLKKVKLVLTSDGSVTGAALASFMVR